jgi:hypothetical protein
MRVCRKGLPDSVEDGLSIWMHEDEVVDIPWGAAHCRKLSGRLGLTLDGGEFGNRSKRSSVNEVSDIVELPHQFENVKWSAGMMTRFGFDNNRWARTLDSPGETLKNPQFMALNIDLDDCHRTSVKIQVVKTSFLNAKRALWRSRIRGGF